MKNQLFLSIEPIAACTGKAPKKAKLSMLFCAELMVQHSLKQGESILQPSPQGPPPAAMCLNLHPQDAASWSCSRAHPQQFCPARDT